MDDNATNTKPVNPELLAILACPKCKAPVAQAADTLRCQAKDCGLIYPIQDGIPIMLIDQAKKPA